MRKSVLLIMMLFAVSMAANAQKFALIDTEYIMKNIPAAQSANEQMQEATKKYQSEVEALAKEAQKMFQDYQAKSSTLSAAQKTKTEDAIVAKEKAAAELKRNYFGPEGELAKMRDKLITPIQDLHRPSTYIGLERLHSSTRLLLHREFSPETEGTGYTVNGTRMA